MFRNAHFRAKHFEARHFRPGGEIIIIIGDPVCIWAKERMPRAFKRLEQNREFKRFNDTR